MKLSRRERRVKAIWKRKKEKNRHKPSLLARFMNWCRGGVA